MDTTLLLVIGLAFAWLVIPLAVLLVKAAYGDEAACNDLRTFRDYWRMGE